MHGEVGHFITQILILLGGATVVSIIFHRLRLPSLLAFLLVGFICGPKGLQIVSDTADLQALAELGLVFLLFVLGLEFSLPKLMALRHTVFRLGSAQFIMCTGVFFAAFYWWGLSWQAAFIVSGGLALSSTAIVFKELSQRGQLHFRHGQIAIGILLFQDLVAVGLLISVPLLSGSGDTGTALEVFLGVGKSLVLLVIFFLAARFVLPLLLSEVTRVRSDELLVLSALVIVLVAGLITSSIGLSMELGAFLAGMMLGDSRFRHQLETDVRPMRDIFLGLFFISIGMLVDTAMLSEYWFRIIVCGLLLLAFKTVIIAAVAKMLGESWRNALPAGLALSQGGEFLFALLALATRDNLVAPDVASFLISMTIVSMALTPLLINNANNWADWLMKRWEKPVASLPVMESTLDAEAHHDHVVILGFGRVGQTIARFLRSLDLDYLALETDSVRITEASAAGEPVYYGDSSRKDILKTAGVANASLLVISFDDAKQTQHILHLVKELNPELKVLARTRDDSNLDALLAAGATEVVPETLEASLTLVSHVLVLLGIPARKIHGLIDKARQDRYRMLHGFYHGTRVAHLDATSEVLHAVPINDGFWACGKKLSDINWPVRHDPLSEIKRDNQSLYGDELANEEIKAGDVVLLSGRIEEVERCEAVLLSGQK